MMRERDRRHLATTNTTTRASTGIDSTIARHDTLHRHSEPAQNDDIHKHHSSSRCISNLLHNDDTSTTDSTTITDTPDTATMSNHTTTNTPIPIMDTNRYSFDSNTFTRHNLNCYYTINTVFVSVSTIAAEIQNNTMDYDAYRYLSFNPG